MPTLRNHLSPPLVKGDEKDEGRGVYCIFSDLIKAIVFQQPISDHKAIGGGAMTA